MNKKKHIWSFFGLAVTFVVLWTICNLSSVTSVFGAVLSVLTPILVGFSIAFFLNIPLRFLEKLWIKWFSAKRRGIRRAVCIVLSLLFVVGVVALLLGILIPQLVINIRDRVIPRIPFYIEELNMWYGSLKDFAAGFSIDLPEFTVNEATVMGAIGSFIAENKNLIIDQALNIATTSFSVVFDAVFAIVIAIYVLAQKETLGRQARKVLYAIFSEKNAERVLTLARLTEKTFSKFLTGQVTEAFIIAFLCFIGMLIFKMPYPLIVSVMVGTTALIPILGAFIGTGIGAVLILFESPVKAIWFVVFIIVLQQIEGNLIYPKVVGTHVGLPGLWVLVAVTIGSEFGIVGMFVAVPLASLLYTVTRQVVNATLKGKGLDGVFDEEEPEKPKKEKKKKEKKPRKGRKNKKEAMEAEDGVAVGENAETAEDGENAETTEKV